MMPADRQATTVSYPQRFGNKTDKRSTNTFNTEREMNANVFQDLQSKPATSQKLIIDFSGNNATTDTQKGNQRAAFPGLWSKGFQNLT